ncbi:MAG: class I SAM-dependent methyltransferase [Sorangiineae bacterium]|nr:class I SAM-dependent methyltransferase [Polyangiaceae bacterium]MEB2322952.1 class I SAM-dependent methyltransferase [Sorangiineae bacterium]
MENRDHWDDLYASKGATQPSFFAPHLTRSLDFLERAGLHADASVIDVGGGASTLVDDLLARGVHRVTVADLSERALDLSRARLGARAEHVTWLAGDVTALELPPASFDFWHDRATFHFLVSPASRAAYCARLAAAVKPGGGVVVASFAPDGPERCCGLPVRRYSADALAAELRADFTLEGAAREAHRTPTGATQPFLYAWFRRRGTSAPRGSS